MSRQVSVGTKIVRAALPIVVLAAGIAVFAMLLASKPDAKKADTDVRGALVEVMPAVAAKHTVEVFAQGTVLPARTVVVQPEVAGRIVWHSDNLVPGGRVAAGETLVRLDAREYQLALRQQEAAVDRAELELELEVGRKRVAEREWELLGDDGAGGGDKGALALREPQLRTAKVAVDAANSGLDRAKLNVSRTVLKAPFNAFVRSESVEQGQLVGPQTPLATLVGTDQFWVQVSVPVEQIGRVQVPGFNAPEGAGSTAEVWQDLGGERVQRTGRLVRVLGELDPFGGMARILVEIDDPFGLRAGAPSTPLLLGAFVNVRLSAGEVDGAIELPRVAIHDGDHVYVMTADDRLEIRAVQIGWRFPDRVLVTGGLQPGERVITSRLGNPIDGMHLRVNTTPDAGTTVKAEAR